MDILDRIRNTTAASLEGIRSDFDDLPRGHFSAPKATGMTRIVEGADDLVHPRAGRTSANAGRSIAQDWTTVRDSVTGDDGSWEDHNGDTCNNPHCCPTGAPADARSEGQVRYMNNLIDWISEKDTDAGAAARTWTDNVTAAGKWSYNPADKFSISEWINRLKAKNAALNAAAKSAPVAPVAVADAPALPVKLDKNGKPMPLYYAVGPDDDTKFYRIKPGNKPGFYFVDLQASDDFYPQRNGATKAAIISAIVDAGPDACMARYGQLIGRCGRCSRTLTDALSRSRGIGPDCWEKM